MDLYQVLVEYFGEEFEERLRRVLEDLAKENAFRILVGTVISQMTNSKNTRIALKRIENRLGITPHIIARAPIEVLEECLRPAGLYRVKARKLKLLAKKLIEDLEGDLSRLEKMRPEEVRSYLMKLPGVGFKTADILLLFYFKHPIMPVDTHISRIAKRLGLVSKSAGYEDIRRAIEATLKGGHHRVGILHLMLIEFGRRVCRARRPKCDICPLKDVCNYYKLRCSS